MVKQNLAPCENVSLSTEQTSRNAAEVGSGNMHTTEESQEGESSMASAPNYVNQLAKLLLKWKQERRLPESTLHEIANDVIFFVKAILEDDRLHSNIELANIVDDVLQIREQNQLLTASGRSNYWRMHFLFVEPKTIVLDRAPNGKADTMEYVPLCEVLK